MDGDVERKSALRASALAARRGLSNDQRAGAATLLGARLLALPELRRARTVLGYAALDDEIGLREVLESLQARSVRTLLPRVRGEHLELVAVRELTTLAAGYRGVHEPPGRSVDPSVVELALIPGVACDPHGGRLGHGGGHYDRLLPTLPERTVRVGVAFACQVVPRVEVEAHDALVDVVVTDRATYRTRAREPGPRHA